MIHFDGSIENLTTIKVMGIGGGGCNAVDRMIESGFNDVEYVCVNTDVQALYSNKALEKIQIGPDYTKGLGAGGDPDVGRRSAEESLDEIKEVLEETDIIFLLAGFGGGTGTGALPVITKAAKEMNILTIPVVTKPFLFEGRKRSMAADGGIEKLNEENVSIIIVPNEKLLRIVSEETSVQDAFLMTDKYLMLCVQSLHSLLTKPGLINVDFADVRSVMSYPGHAVLGQGTGEGKGKVSEAVDKALSSPILEKDSLFGAKGLLVHISSGKDVSLMEVNKAMSEVEALTDNEANIIFGTTIDENAESKAHVTIIATGLSERVIRPIVQEEPKKEMPEKEVKEEPETEIKQKSFFDDENSEPVQSTLEVIESQPEEETPPKQEFNPIKKKEAPILPLGKEVKDNKKEVEPEEKVEISDKAIESKPEPPLKPKPDPVKPKSGQGKGKQIVLNFAPGQKGRFEKMEPTLYDGEDLDVPTFIRKKKMFQRSSEEDAS